MRKALLRDKKMQRKLEEEKIKDGIKILPNFKSEIDKLRLELKVKNEELEKHEKEREMLSRLYDMGVINEAGELLKKNELFEMD